MVHLYLALLVCLLVSPETTNAQNDTTTTATTTTASTSSTTTKTASTSSTTTTASTSSTTTTTTAPFTTSTTTTTTAPFTTSTTTTTTAPFTTSTTTTTTAPFTTSKTTTTTAPFTTSTTTTTTAPYTTPTPTTTTASTTTALYTTAKPSATSLYSSSISITTSPYPSELNMDRISYISSITNTNAPYTNGITNTNAPYSQATSFSTSGPASVNIQVSSVGPYSIYATLPFNYCVPLENSVLFQVAASCNPCDWAFGDGHTAWTVGLSSRVRNFTAEAANLSISVNVTSGGTSYVTTQLQNAQNQTISGLCVQKSFKNTSSVGVSIASTLQVNATASIKVTFYDTPLNICCLIKSADISENFIWGDMYTCTSLPAFASQINSSQTYWYYPSQNLMKPNFSSVSSLNATYGLNFPSVGRKMLSFYSANFVSSVTRQIYVYVADLKTMCSMPEVNMVVGMTCKPGVNCDPTLTTTIQFLLSNNITLTPNVSVTCPNATLAYYDWQFYVYSAYSLTSSRRLFNATDTQSGLNLTSITLPALTLPLGVYHVCVNVSIPEQNGAWTMDCADFTIVPSPVVACINNFSTFLNGIYGDTNFILDGSCSYDPDVSSPRQQTLNYTWSCSSECEPSCASSVSVGNVSYPTSSKGCFQPIEVQDSGVVNFHLLSDWTSVNSYLNPLMQNASLNTRWLTQPFLWYNPTPDKLQLNTGTMFPIIYLTVSLTVTRSSAAASSMGNATWKTTIQIQYPLTNLTFITCQSNCYSNPINSSTTPPYVMNLNTPLKLSATYLSASPPDSYTWVVVPVSCPPCAQKDVRTMLVSAAFNDKLSPYSSSGFYSDVFLLDKNLPLQDAQYASGSLLFIVFVRSGGSVGLAYALFQLDAFPAIGSCGVVASPSSGTALQTVFKFACSCNATVSSWKPIYYSIGYSTSPPPVSSDYATLLEASRQCTWLSIATPTCSFTAGSVLPAVNSTNNSIIICLKVVNAVGSSSMKFVAAATVKPSEKTVSELVRQGSNASIMTALLKANPSGARGYFSGLLSATGGSSDPGVAVMKETVVGVLSANLPVVKDLCTVAAYASVLDQASVFPGQVTSSCLDSLMTATDKLLAAANASKALSGFQDVDAAAQSLFAVTANALNATTTNASADARQAANSIQQQISAVANFVLSQKVAGEVASTYTQNAMTLTCQVQYTEAFEDLVVWPNRSSCTRFIFRGTAGLFTSNGSTMAAAYQHTQSTAFPYNWMANSALAQSSTSMVLQDPSSKAQLNVSGLPKESAFHIYLDTNGNFGAGKNSSLLQNYTGYTTPFMKPLQTVSITLPAKTNLFINLQQLRNFNQTVNNASYNGTVKFLLYLAKSRKPTDLDYDYYCELPQTNRSTLTCDSSATSWTQDMEADYLKQLQESPSTWWNRLSNPQNRCNFSSMRVQSPWTCMFPSIMLNNTMNSSYTVAIRAIQWDLKTSTNQSASAQPSSKLKASYSSSLYVATSFTVFLYYAGCFFINESSQTLDTEGCSVGACSSPFVTQCFCNHLTSFTNVFQLPPIAFDVSSVTTDALNNSPAVACFFISILCVYCMLWIAVRRRDLDASEDPTVATLADNHEQDLYAYELVVYTGYSIGAGTTANVSIILVGDMGETKARRLHKSDKTAFTAGSRQTYLLTTPDWLGTLSFVRVWHDNSGDSPSWYLSKICVRDLMKKEKYYFIAHEWINYDDHFDMHARIIPVAGRAELKSFAHAFSTQLQNGLVDTHPWFSVATCPKLSPFTRVQRLTCCLVIVCTASLFSLLGFIVQNKRDSSLSQATSDPNPVLFAVGSVQVTSWTMTMSVISTLCIVPVNVLIAIMFRYRKTHTTSIAPSITPDCKDVDENRYSKCIKSLFPFPWWIHYVAYAVSFLVLFATYFCAFVLAYSNLPQQWQQLAWLQTIVLSLLQDIFVVNPLKIMLIVAVYSLLFRQPFDDSAQRSPVNYTGRLKQTGTDATRKQYVQSYAPQPTGDLSIDAQQRLNKQRNARTSWSALAYWTYVLLLMITSSLTPLPYASDQADTFVQVLPQPANPIKSIEDFYSYLDTQLLRFFSQTKWYDNNTAWPSRFGADTNFYILQAQLRQVRAAPNSCMTPNLMQSVVAVCSGEPDKQAYARHWSVGTTGSAGFSYTFEPDALVNSASATLTGYSAGGYVVQLYDNGTLRRNLTSDLRAAGWLDRLTRCVFVQLLLYNANSNVFISSLSRFEFSAAQVRLTRQFYTSRLDPYTTASGWSILLLEVLAALASLVFLAAVVNRLLRDKAAFFSDSWNVLDGFVGLLLCCAGACFVANTIISRLYVSSLQALRPLSNVSPAIIFSEIQYFFLGLAVFFAAVGLLRTLSCVEQLLILQSLFKSFIFSALVSFAISVTLSLTLINLLASSGRFTFTFIVLVSPVFVFAGFCLSSCLTAVRAVKLQLQLQQWDSEGTLLLEAFKQMRLKLAESLKKRDFMSAERDTFRYVQKKLDGEEWCNVLLNKADNLTRRVRASISANETLLVDQFLVALHKKSANAPKKQAGSLQS